MSKLINFYSGKPIEEPRSIGVELLGTIISNIINQDGDEKTDGQVIDEIVQELKKYNLYKERKQ